MKKLFVFIFTGIFIFPLLNYGQPLSDSDLALNTAAGSESEAFANTIEPDEINADVVLSFVTFDVNSAALKKTTIYELERLSTILKRTPSLQLEIVGYTDNVGSDEYNQRLAQKRIDAVLFYFKHQSDIDTKRVSVKNLGESKPVADNATQDGRKRNRRVEMKLKKQALAD